MSDPRKFFDHHEPRDPRRVHWMELFFDLVFVAFVGQLAHGLHDDPGWAEFGTFVALAFPAWWGWMNITATVNLSPELSSRRLGLAMLAAMAGAGVMAVAAPDGLGERAWAFSLGNAALRIVLLALWLRRHRTGSQTALVRILVYNGGTAALWTVAAFLPAPENFVLWAVAILIEVVSITTSREGWRNLVASGFIVEHLAERLGLFVVIVLGESVLTIVAEVADDWEPAAGLSGALGFLVAALLGWAFFQYGTGTMEQGLRRLQTSGSYAGLRDTVMLLPFLLVVGITAVSGGIAAAIAHPEGPLPLGSAVALGGGIALFYAANTAIVLRYGQPWRAVLSWSPLSIALALTIVPLATAVPAPAGLAIAAAVLLIVTGFVEARRRIAVRPE
ncbi:low temperature requirement protein A [Microbacteriaceae bacterium VKM Ac-2854]|nr:low temperature requirement protein A [Microbacteriaceae bacterium VKM Ac-2854]